MTIFTRLLFLIAGMLLAMASCNKRETTISGPGIAQRISEFSGYACKGGTVTKYVFQGEEVYLLSGNCNYPDEGLYVYDAGGNSVCTIGGLAGSRDCRGTEFFPNAKDPVVVYTKR